MKILIFPHGEGLVNSLNGLNPTTTGSYNIINGSLQSFWKLLNYNGIVLNWSGDIAPVVYQYHHFVNEILLHRNNN